MPILLLLIYYWLLSSLWFTINASPCKRSVYIFPLVTNIEAMRNLSNTALRSFSLQCSHSITPKTGREQINFLLPSYIQFTPCTVNSHSDDCETISTGLDQVYLNRTRSYNIASHLKNLLQNDVSSCTEYSVGIFITDVPCSQFRMYPDINQLFGYGLKDTIQNFNNIYFLHTVIIWLVNDTKNYKQFPCDGLKNYKFDPKHDYLEFNLTDYKEFVTRVDVCNQVFYPITRPNKTNKAMSRTVWLIVVIGCPILGIAILTAIVFCLLWLRKSYVQTKLEFFANEHRNRRQGNIFDTADPKDEWDIMANELRVERGDLLGSGISATVYKGRLKKIRGLETIEMDVAVKVAHSYADSTTRKEMLDEIELMKTLKQHENLLIMVGCVRSPVNPVIVTEFCYHGDLLKVLRQHELHFLSNERCQEVDVCLILSDLLRIASQVCCGMSYLVSLNYVHRDLAARNVMIMDNLVARVGDFGLCRALENSVHIQKYGKVPVKHMPYEALTAGVFSEKSDVWAYGVMLFEMFTGGEQPFSDIQTGELANYLQRDGRLQMPLEMPRQLVKFANTKCFALEPEDRATFTELQVEIDNIYKKLGT